MHLSHKCRYSFGNLDLENTTHNLFLRNMKLLTEWGLLTSSSSPLLLLLLLLLLLHLPLLLPDLRTVGQFLILKRKERKKPFPFPSNIKREKEGGGGGETTLSDREKES